MAALPTLVTAFYSMFGLWLNVLAYILTLNFKRLS